MDRGIIESSPPRGSLVISSKVGSLSKRTVMSVQRPTATTSDLCSFSVSGVISMKKKGENNYNRGTMDLLKGKGAIISKKCLFLLFIGLNEWFGLHY